MGLSVVTFSSSVPRKKDMKFEADVTKSISGTSQLHWPPQTHMCASSERPSLITQSMQFRVVRRALWKKPEETRAVVNSSSISL